MKLSALLLAATVVLVVGCQNPKDANNENFSKAISAYLAHQEESGGYCIGSKIDHFEVEDFKLDQATRALMKIGFLEITGHRTGAGFFTITGYEFTSKGRESFTPGKGFCFGKPQLGQIVNFTDPGPAGTKSRVIYSYQLTSVPAWANGPDGQAFHSIMPAAYGLVQSTDTLVLTGNGWVHESFAPH
jgi:hypothetical protein